ncbi:transcription-repair coupling factor [Salibacter halophilus]|uniref:Transcription-repair-coupling factor n=1 Tax=Salibacter halophilus TaxID=1803916 RepID=A0A6N6M6B6_9FLAO|nr:transcription-repair coupling factor [Salibacter halophilus]KAB1063830.1 transcription-repair coupling factor [Salibacter halophilus]
MTKEQLLERFQNSAKILQLKEKLKDFEKGHITLKGFCGSAPAVYGGTLMQTIKQPQLFIVNDKEEAAYFVNDLESIIGQDKVFYFPSSSRLPYQIEKTDNANVLHRAEILATLTKRSRPVCIVTYPEALSEKVSTKKQLQQNTLELKKGNEISIDFINELLFEYKFERVDFVTQPGEFSIRGGIVDIFSFANDYPYRVELFGDEIDSIRTFDPGSQLSIKHFQQVRIVPNIQNKNLMESRQHFLEFLPPSTKVWIKDFNLLQDHLKMEYERAEKAFADLGETEIEHLPPEKLFTREAEMEKILQKRVVIEFGITNHFEGDAVLEFQQQPQPNFNKNFELLSKKLHENVKENIDNVILAGSEKQLTRLHNIFEDLEKEKHFNSLLFSLHEGFTDFEVGMACYTDHQIFERFHRFRLKEGFKDAQQKLSLKEITELQRGDFVVHVDHGVGRFEGLVRIENNGKLQEAIKLSYSGTDVLYVSIHSLHRISKFSGKEGHEPKINKLGTNTWKKLKKKTKSKIKEIAYDLISLYAKRKEAEGYAFTPDSYLQNELEASFIYEDTPDQEKATQAVKEDMEQSAPMDRLICGDVGFGKTEIAIRAAFKAAVDGKQVAVLVPTTILALQHYKSFSERLKDFPVEVDFVNRFKKTSKIKQTLKNLEEGKLDIIIGTHRLVGKDVKFNDLGLLIIDEEQKFGVGVKDKLKTIKENVDTLTLTATPIPRTLQFSLMGARDLSVINTPPPNRQPVQTELHTFNEEIIRDAVSYELARDGQVFVINNRVQNIQEVAGMVQRVVPDARVITAHGQMDGKDLEERMMKFVDGEYDVLIATTIIESGLDIPNANTIIINNAHNFGLSDLHQMRGRVGRSNRKAFCYLLSPPLSTMPSDARKRLTAISQFSDLGSGINIAMRDLDIRGAGNLLGGEQSGFISEIGFDMYQKILNEAITELKENEFKDLFKASKQSYVEDTVLETDLEIMISDTYVNNITERLRLYKDLSDVESETQLDTFRQELIDRFGPIPDETESLIDSVKMKWLGKAIGFEKIVLKANKLICYFIPDQESPYFQSPAFNRVLEYVKQNMHRCELKQRKEKLSLVFKDITSIQEALNTLRPILQEETVEQ